MKNLIVTALTSLMLLALAQTAHAAQSCGGDGDGSAMFYCESTSRDISVDGLLNSDGTNSARLTIKLREKGAYQGSEQFDLKLAGHAMYQNFKVSGTGNSTSMKIALVPNSIREICPGDSAKFKAVLKFKTNGVSGSGQAQLNCSYYQAH